MRFFVGIDAGSRACKIALLDEKGVLCCTGVAIQGIDANEVAETLLDSLLEGCHATREDIIYCISTGYGRNMIKIAHAQVTEITCHAKGVHAQLPENQLIIEIGGQDAKGILINEKGIVKEFVMNDRCAAGTGAFLEMVGVKLGVKLDEFSTLLKEKNESERLYISSMCVVFAESEIIGLLASGKKRGDILVAVQQAIAQRIMSMIAHLLHAPRLVFTGGVAKITGMREALSTVLKQKIQTLNEPQLTGAHGASLIAFERYNNQQKESK